MLFLWRHYRGSEILTASAIIAPCRVRAKAAVTIDMKATKVVPSRYRSKWSEKAAYTITGIDDMRGIRYPMSSDREFIVFFEPEREYEMINAMTDPKQDNRQTMF